jgi:hypothetical protein
VSKSTKDEMKKEMENKIKESIEKKKQVDDKDHHNNTSQDKQVKHYKEYTHQPEKTDSQ